MVPPMWMRVAVFAVSLTGGFAAASSADAALALNAFGSGAGFTLTTTVGGWSYSSQFDYTLVSFAVPTPNGNIIAPANGGPTYLFSDTDNQVLANNIGTAPLPSGPGFAMTTMNGQAYGSQSTGGYYKFNPNGTIASTIPVVGATSVYGLWGDAATNRLLSSAQLTSGPAIISIDPTNGNYQVVANINYTADGLTTTPDGSIVYVANYSADTVIGYSLQTSTFGQTVFTTAYLGHGSDGMGVLAGNCKYAGNIVVNNNDGTVGLIDTGTALETTIASGGNRGDYASPDPTNGTLFLSQNDQVARLKAPTGCSIGTVPAPEPSGGLAAGVGLAVLALLRSRRERGDAVR